MEMRAVPFDDYAEKNQTFRDICQDYEKAYNIINRMAKPSNRKKCRPSMILTIHVMRSKTIRISMVIRNNISIFDFLVKEAMK